MAEETNNQAPLTARQVAEQNPELNKFREIAFGTNYLDDIDAGTGTARFYSGFGMQPTYTGTNTDQAIADAVTAQAEAVAAPVQSGGQDQVTGGLTDNTPFEQNLIDEGAGVQIAPGQPVVAPGEIPITQQEIDEYNLNTPFEQNLINQGVGVQTEPGAPVGAQGERFDDSPLSVSQQADIASQTNFGLDYNQLDQEGQREIDEQIKATPDITPATSINFNPLKTAANIITGGLTDIPFVGTAVQKAADYFKGGEDGSVASETDFSTMGDPMVDAEENQPFNQNFVTQVSDPVETNQLSMMQEYYNKPIEERIAGTTGYNLQDISPAGLTQEQIEKTGIIDKAVNAIGNVSQEQVTNAIQAGRIGLAALSGGTSEVINEIARNILGKVAGKTISNTLSPMITDVKEKQEQTNIMNLGDQQFAETGDYDVYSGDRGTTSGPDYSGGVTTGTTFDAEDEEDYSTPSPASEPDQRDRGGGGGGGGSSGGGKIVCTMMNETYGFGSFRNKIWQKYAKDNLTREHEKGYHKIFLPLVRLSKTNIVIRKVLEHIAVHRTIDIRQEARGKRHILGRVYRKVLEPICYLVGKYGKR